MKPQEPPIAATRSASRSPKVSGSSGKVARQAATDRRQARRDFEINLKAELEILALHAKLDQLLAKSAATEDRQGAAGDSRI